MSFYGGAPERGEKLRNPAGVYVKLCNFLRFDPAYTGKGLVAGNRDHGRLFDNDRHEQQFGGDHEGRGHDAHIPVVPETNPAPVLGAMLLVGGIAYEIHRRRANKVSVKE